MFDCCDDVLIDDMLDTKYGILAMLRYTAYKMHVRTKDEQDFGTVLDK